MNQRSTALIFTLIGGAFANSPVLAQQKTWTVSRLPGQITDVGGLPVSTFDAVALAPDGGFAGFDRKAGTVVTVGSNLDHPTRFGRRGRGPGEFMVPGKMTFFGDTLVVNDMNRLLLFHDGKYVRETSLQAARQQRFGIDGIFADRSILGYDYQGTGVMITGDGNMMERSISSGDEVLDPVTACAPRKTVLVRYGDAASGKVDTAFTLTARTDWLHIPTPDDKIWSRQPFIDGDLFAFSPVGALVVRVDRTAAENGNSAFYTVTARSSAGQVYSASIPYKPIPLTGAIVELWTKDLMKQFEQSFAAAPDAKKQIPKALYRPKFVPPVKQVFVASDGSVWIERNLGRSSHEPKTWDIIDPSGKLVAKAQTPGRLKELAIDHDRIWGLEEDDEGEVQLVRYGIKR